MSLRIRVYVCMHRCICLDMYVYVSMYVNMYMYVFVCMCIPVYRCLYVHLLFVPSRSRLGRGRRIRRHITGGPKLAESECDDGYNELATGRLLIGAEPIFVATWT